MAMYLQTLTSAEPSFQFHQRLIRPRKRSFCVKNTISNNRSNTNNYVYKYSTDIVLPVKSQLSHVQSVIVM